MVVYQTEMDGFSLVEIEKGVSNKDLVLLKSGFEESFYTVSKVTDKDISFKLFKYTEPVIEETSNIYKVGINSYNFINRPSINQTIFIDNKLFKIISIDKKEKTLELEELKFTIVSALYGIFGEVEGLGYRDRNSDGYKPLKYFKDWSEAYGYVLSERSKGKKVSL